MSSINEKASLPLPSQTTPVQRPKRGYLPMIVLFSVLAFLAFTSDVLPDFADPIRSLRPCHSSKALLKQASCPVQPSPLNIGDDWNPLTDKEYAKLAARRLSAAVQHDTESFDDMPQDPTDPRFDKHYAFADWMYAEYPKVFGGMKHEVVNTHGHLFTWEGTKPELDPIVLMAHIDVVPVLQATLDQWSFPPFEGAITTDGPKGTTGTWIWGRGSSDCKNSLMGIYGALERLVTQGFKPERTIIVANGFDEEIGGARGSGAISTLLQTRYDKVAFLVDEGFTGITFEYGKTVASLGMAEKGSVNIKLKVETLGGHSSVPPAHTGIGIMSLLLAGLEEHPFKPSLSPASPYLKYLTCMSEHAPAFPAKLKKQVKNPKAWPKLAHDLAASDRVLNSFLSTTTAIDLIQGGVKVNALPEVVEATVNHRIAFTSSVNETLEHAYHIIAPLAKSLNFSLSAFDKPSSSKYPSHITLEVAGVKGTYAGGLEPAPITPDDGKSFELMAGTSRHVFGEDTIVTPSGMFANTDTRWFWNLTTNLYRFTPAVVSQNLNQHTVDERISLDGHLNTTRFFYKLIQNSVGWDSE